MDSDLISPGTVGRPQVRWVTAAARTAPHSDPRARRLSFNLFFGRPADDAREFALA